MHNILGIFKFWPDWTTDNRVTCPCLFYPIIHLLSGELYLSVNEKLPVSKFRYFGKYTIQLDGYFCIHVSGHRQTGLEKNTSFVSPGIMVHVVHVLFVLFAVF